MKPRDVQAVRNLLRADSDDFATLARIAELDPARDFRHGDWRDIDFGEDDLSGFDFAGADLAGADLSRARGLRREMFAGARFDTRTKLPPGLFGRVQPQEPVAFLSYVRADDEHNGGGITRLRERLGGEVKAHTVSFEIFQDTLHLKWGQDWKREIRKSLASVTLLIPILTPRFFASAPCRDEVAWFLERERELGRDDLILPLHYIRCPQLTDPDGDPLATELRKRQIVDWRPFRHVPLSDAAARARITELAEHVGAALRRKPPTVAPPVPAQATTTPAPPPPPPPAPSPETPPWAAASGTDEFGDFATIAIPVRGGAPVTQRLRWIAPDVFFMGSPADEPGRFDNEGPRHRVDIAQGFWLFDTPCTQALWQAVMGDNPSRFVSPTRPVEQVSFHDVGEFLARINARAPGLNLTLPSEAQWEFACRAGTRTATHAGPMEIKGARNAPVLDAIAWYGGNSGVAFDLANGHDSSNWPKKQYPHRRAGTRPVGLKRPNAWGLHDMLGNVWEWCADTWHPTYDGAPADGSAWIESGSASRVLRGGSWFYGARYVRSACRVRGVPIERVGGIGFRCARVQAGDQRSGAGRGG